MQSLSDRWASFVSSSGPGSSFTLSLGTLQRQLLPNLSLEGFVLPSRRDVQEALEAGLGELPLSQGAGSLDSRRQTRQSMLLRHFVNFLSLVWQPIISHIECLAKDEPTKPPEANMAALSLEMQGIVAGSDGALPMDDWADFIRRTLSTLLGIDVPSRLLLAALSPIAPLSLEATPANAVHVLRSSLCTKLVWRRELGPTLAAQVSRLLLAEFSELPVPLATEQDLSPGVTGLG